MLVLSAKDLQSALCRIGIGEGCGLHGNADAHAGGA